MKKFMLAAVVLVSVALPAVAKNFAVPEKNPVATLAIPDTWKTEEIEYGYSAKSPDSDIFFLPNTRRALASTRCWKTTATG